MSWQAQIYIGHVFKAKTEPRALLITTAVQLKMRSHCSRSCFNNTASGRRCRRDLITQNGNSCGHGHPRDKICLLMLSHGMKPGHKARKMMITGRRRQFESHIRVKNILVPMIATVLFVVLTQKSGMRSLGDRCEDMVPFLKLY